MCRAGVRAEVQGSFKQSLKPFLEGVILPKLSLAVSVSNLGDKDSLKHNLDGKKY